VIVYDPRMSETEIVTSSERPDLEDQARAAFRGEWPEFIFHDPISGEYTPRSGEYFTRYDILLLDEGQVVAGGWGVPLRWDGSVGTLPDGYDGALVSAVTEHETSVVPDTLSVMAAAVRADRQGRGLAGQVITALRDRAVEDGLQRVIAPVRPTLKSRYPLASMDSFATWMREDGLHRDPWIRTHQRLGATILAPAERSMVISGTVAEWEDWTKMTFPQTGPYVVPAAHAVVEIDIEQDRGTYVETNLWMQHL
jgi:GNAT superfamily N-acetyltransferase